MQTTVTTQSTLFSLHLSNASVKCLMLETKHEEVHLSVVTVIVRWTW